MKNIWYFIYNFIIVPAIVIYFRIYGLFNSKVKKGLRERKRLFENLIINLAGLDRTKKLLWFHSSSLGEFEQAKPIIEKLKATTNVNIVITFFSPSGYDNSLRYPYADVVSYLPLDTPPLATRFLNLIRPTLAVFMRYDIWPNVIWQMKKHNIPILLVDATMRSSSKRKWFPAFSFHKALYKSITKILVVSKDDLNNFKRFNLDDTQLRIVGDTRFDRVYQKSLEAKEKELFRRGFFGQNKVFVFGSSWEADEDVIFPAIQKLLKYDENIIFIIVPHEPTILNLEKIEHSFLNYASTIRFSFLNNYKGERIIIIDSIGILLTLYHYGDLAYVGGSFKQGIHNVLEPAVYGLPVLFGPRIENSREAQTLVKLGCGFIVRNKKEAYRKMRTFLSKEDFRKEVGKISYEFVHKNIGAAGKILEEIYKYI